MTQAFCIADYVFDGHENDNIRWMNNDIAVVKIEDGFDFARRVRGCEFVPKPVCYNNQSHTLENPGTVATIAGWGTTAKYNDVSSPFYLKFSSYNTYAGLVNLLL